MKNIIIILLMLVCTRLNATDTLHYYQSNFIVGDNSPICKGDTISLISVLSCVCGGSHYINTKSYFNSNICNSISCEAVSVSTPVFQGSGIVQTTFSYPQNVNCSTNINWSATVAPETTTSYILFWEEYKREDYSSCGLWDRVYVYHFRDTFTVNVQSVPIPTFTVSNLNPHCGEQISLNFTNCNPAYGLIMQDDCGNFLTGSNYGQNCSNPTLQLNMPEYMSVINLRAQYQYWSAPWCRGEWSEFQTVSIKEIPNSNPCSPFDPDIAAIEAMLADSNLIQNRDDYHHYETEEVICTMPWTGVRPCTPSSIWSFWKSRTDNQAPIYNDYPPLLAIIPNPTIAIIRIGSSLLFPPSNTTPITSSCQMLNLPQSPERVILSFLLSGVFNWPGKCPSNTPSSFWVEPIKIVVDEGCKCITNYTKPGHVLYPGKVRRCLVKNNCNTFSIHTTGTGFHYCGDNNIGAGMAISNEVVGKSTFVKVTNRFVYNFNH